MSQPTTAEVEIASDGDLLVTVREYNNKVIGDDGKRPVRCKVVMRVRRQILMDHSEAFQRMLVAKGHFQENHSQEITLEDDTETSMKVWFKVLHGTQPVICQSEDAEHMQQSINEIYEAIEVSRKYFIHLEKLDRWFKSWMQAQKPVLLLHLEVARSLISAAYEFDDYVTFGKLTKYMVYDTVGYIDVLIEHRHPHLRLPRLIIQQLNAARGHLKMVLHKGLQSTITNFLDAICACKADGLWNYEKALQGTGSWPVEDHARYNSINELTAGFEDFSYVPPPKACLATCSKNLSVSVKRAVERTDAEFDGICLDCLNKELPKSYKDMSRRSGHEAYIGFVKREKLWNSGCRWKHGESTWYYSFHARREVRDYHKDGLYERRKAVREKLAEEKHARDKLAKEKLAEEWLARWKARNDK